MSKRRTHSSAFKARVAMEAISGRKPKDSEDGQAKQAELFQQSCCAEV